MRATRWTLVLAVPFALALAGCDVPPDPQREVPQLSELAQQHADPLLRAGIAKIVSWSDRIDQPVQVLTRAGPVYFPYPRDLPLFRFALVVDGARVTVKSDDYDPRDHERDTAALRRVVDEALRQAGDHVAASDRRDSTRR
jgi:hypothetical protein